MKVFILLIFIPAINAFEKVPPSPVDLKVEELWGRKARVSWSPPHNGTSPVTNYVLRYWLYAASGDRRRLMQIVVSNEQTSILLDNLYSGCNYGLNLVAENEIGQSEPSHTISFTTNEEEPYWPTIDINVEVKGETSLLVTWKPQPNGVLNEKLEGFYVGYKMHGLQHHHPPYTFKKVDYVPAGVQNYLITDLRKDTEYSIIVKAFNKIGRGPGGGDIIVKTSGGAISEEAIKEVSTTPTDLEVPNTLFDLKVPEIWSNCVRVSWSTPYTGNNSNTKYVLQYGKENGKMYNLKEVITNAQTSILIKDLYPATNYSLCIAEENTIGNDIVNFTTTEEEPSSTPMDVNVEVKGETSLLVTWKPPSKDTWNGKLEGFYVGYRSRDYIGYSLKVAAYVPGGLQECLITNLRKDTEYNVIVQAFNKVGYGPPSQDLTIRTLGGE